MLVRSLVLPSIGDANHYLVLFNSVISLFY